MSKQDTQPQTKVVTYARLTPGVYEAFENEVSRHQAVTEKTTDIQAGFQLGVEHCLRILRRGYVVSQG